MLVVAAVAEHPRALGQLAGADLALSRVTLASRVTMSRCHDVSRYLVAALLEA